MYCLVWFVTFTVCIGLFRGSLSRDSRVQADIARTARGGGQWPDVVHIMHAATLCSSMFSVVIQLITRFKCVALTSVNSSGHSVDARRCPRTVSATSSSQSHILIISRSHVTLLHLAIHVFCSCHVGWCLWLHLFFWDCCVLARIMSLFTSDSLGD